MKVNICEKKIQNGIKLESFHNLKISQKEERIFVIVCATMTVLVYVKLDCKDWINFKVRRWCSAVCVLVR